VASFPRSLVSRFPVVHPLRKSASIFLDITEHRYKRSTWTLSFAIAPEHSENEHFRNSQRSSFDNSCVKRSEQRSNQIAAEETTSPLSFRALTRMQSTRSKEICIHSFEVKNILSHNVAASKVSIFDLHKTFPLSISFQQSHLVCQSNGSQLLVFLSPRQTSFCRRKSIPTFDTTFLFLKN
jgi:hypothetical protein